MGIPKNRLNETVLNRAKVYVKLMSKKTTQFYNLTLKKFAYLDLAKDHVTRVAVLAVLVECLFVMLDLLSFV